MNRFTPGFAYLTLVDIENQPTPDGSGHTVQFRRVSAELFRDACGFAFARAACSNGPIRCRRCRRRWSASRSPIGTGRMSTRSAAG